MADEEDYSGVYYGTGDGEAKQADDSVSFGDYLKTGASGIISGAIAPVVAGARALTNDSDNETALSINKMSKVLQGYLNTEADNINDSRSESAKRRAEAAVTSKDFWDHPFSATMLKATGMAGPMAAMIFSGGPVGAAIVGGALNAGSYLNDLDKALDKAPDAKLQENEWYASLRSMGMSEADARDDLKQKLFDNKILLNFAAGAIGGAFGPAGKLAAGVSGKAAVGLAGAEAGAVRRGVAGAVEGAGAGALEGGTSASTLQQSEEEVGLRKGFDGEALVNAVLEGGLMGGVLGGAAGALVKSKGKKKETTDVVEAPADQGTQEQGSGEPITPVEAAPQVAAQAPDGSVAPTPVPGAKGQAVKNKGKTPKVEATTVDALSPSPEQALALVDAQQPVQPDVAAASARTANPTPEPVAPPIEAPRIDAPPTDVVAAAERTPAPEIPPVTPEVTPAIEQPPVSSVAAPTPEAIVAPKGKAKADEVKAKRAPKVLRNLTEDGLSPEELAPAKTHVLVEPKLDAEGNKVATGRKMSPKTVERVSAHRAVSDEIVAAHPATEAEANYFTDHGAFGAVIKRAQAMIAAADAAGHKVPSQIKPSANKDQVTDHPNTQLLVYAKNLVTAAKSKAKGTKIPEAVARFKQREDGVKSGRGAEELAERRAEGDAAMRRDQGDAGERGATTDTPESILAAKEAGSTEESATDVAAANTVSKEQDVDAKDSVVTARSGVAASAKGTVRGVGDGTETRKVKTKAGKEAEVEGAKAASEVKKVTASDEMKAKYAAMLEQANRKNGDDSRLEAAEAVNKKTARVEKEADVFDAALTKKNGPPADALTGEPVAIIKTQSARQALAGLDLAHLAGIPKQLAAFMQKRLTAMAGDIPVHLLGKEEFARTTGKLEVAFQNDGEGTLGMSRLHPSGSAHQILIRGDVLRSPRDTAHIVMHEIAHGATQRALIENAEIHNQVKSVMAEVKEALHGARPEVLDAMEYAMTNPREFIAEAFSNPRVQEILSRVTITDKLARELKLDQTNSLSVWDAIVAVVRGVIEKTTGRLPEGHRAISAVLRIGETVGRENNRQALREHIAGSHIEIKQHGLSDSLDLDAAFTKEAGKRAWEDFKTDRGSWLTTAKNKLSSTFMLKERHNERFGPSRPLNRAFDLRAMQAREADKILNDHGGAEVVRRTAELERSHPADMAKGADVLFDASLHDVNLGPGANNDHLGKDKTKGWQGKKLLASLQRRYDALAPEVQKHLQESVKFFRDIHNEVSMATIKNVLEVANIHQHGLAERIFKDGVTDADRTLHAGEIIKALEKATSLKEMKGWYAPFRRYGDFISTAEHTLVVPANATQINSHTLQFHDPKSKVGSRRAAKAYIEQASHTSQGNLLKANEIRRVTVDKNDLSKLVDPSDLDAVVAYRVEMQTKHTEFHDKLSEAQRNQEALTAGGLTNTKVHKREDAHSASPGLEGALGTVMRSLEQNKSFQSLDVTQQGAVRQSLMDASVRAMSSTNVKTTMAARRNVAGMSHDLGRVTADYARMTANYLAQLRFRPKIDKVFAEMRAYIKANEYDKDNHRRQEVYEEFQSRIYGRGEQLASREPNPAIRKLLQVSRLSRLAGVSFHVINSQEPWTTSMPVIGGRHGFTQTARTMASVYNAIGARGGLVSGLKDIGRAYSSDTGFTDYVKVFKDNIAQSNTMGGSKSARFMEMLDYLNARNLYGNDTIYEVGKSANPNGNVAARALDRADLMANQVGSAIEAINRTVTGLTAYDLEFKKNGGNHEAAMHYAYTTAHTTMGDYSAWNAAPMFNTRAGQIALQFKKFGHKTYYLLGKTIGNAARGDKEAMRQFAGLMVTHGLVAGVLGLPTEPFKVALMAANMVGVTGFTPEDYDNAVRQLAARVAGQKGGEIISKGLYRGIGIEVSGRMGLDSMLTYGNPKSEKANDLKAFLFDTAAGAPAGLVLDWIASAQAIAKGDFATAIQKASPVRAVGDIAKAVTGAAGPKLSPQGREIHDSLGPWETGVRAVGFTPSRVAESGAMRGHVASEGKRTGAARSELINAWVSATGAKKVIAQRAVQKWNAGNTKELQIAQKDLTSAAKRRATEEENGSFKDGIKIGKRTKEIYDRAAATYSVR